MANINEVDMIDTIVSSRLRTLGLNKITSKYTINLPENSINLKLIT